jgi:hypothetical protein
MPIPQAHISGWDESTTDEKLQALYDWCIILTDEVRAAKADARALIERVKELEGELTIPTGVLLAAPKARGAAATSDALKANSAPPTLSIPITLPEPQRTSGISQRPSLPEF